MRIINSTFGSIASIFDAINDVATLASDTASKGLQSIRNENIADKMVSDKELARRIDEKNYEIDKAFEKLAQDREKLEESSFYKKGQKRKLMALIEIEKFRQMKEKSSDEKIAALQEMLSELESKPATSVAEVKVVK